MIRPKGANRKKSTPTAKILLALIIIAGIALALQPLLNWINGQLQELAGGARQDTLKEQNRRNWCADVLESESISAADYSYCEDFWKD